MRRSTGLTGRGTLSMPIRSGPGRAGPCQAVPCRAVPGRAGPCQDGPGRAGPGQRDLAARAASGAGRILRVREGS